MMYFVQYDWNYHSPWDKGDKLPGVSDVVIVVGLITSSPSTSDMIYNKT